MKKRVIAFVLCVSLFAFGCTRTEKPAGWDEKHMNRIDDTANTDKNKDNEIDKENEDEKIQVAFDDILTSIQTDEDIEKSFKDFKDFIDYVKSALIKAEDFSKETIDEFIEKNRDRLEDVYYKIHEAKGDVDEFFDELEDDIKENAMEFDKFAKVDDFISYAKGKLQEEYPNLSATDRTNFIKENYDKLVEMFEKYKDEFKGKDFSAASFLNDISGVESKDKFISLFGKDATFDDYKEYVHSIISERKKELNSLEIDKYIEENEADLKDLYEEMFFGK